MVQIGAKCGGLHVRGGSAAGIFRVIDKGFYVSPVESSGIGSLAAFNEI
jgi:hypothetical protein